jgi:outer membrane receptor protein involved in Fe transport
MRHFALRTARARHLLVAAALLAAQGAAAATAPSEEAVEGEIVVTAQRRAESIQEVPLSISAFSAQQIQRSGFTKFDDYATRIPNLAFSASNSSSTDGALTIAIRGVFGASTTGFYIDDSPLVQALNPRVIDLERIEVLRGPQGTLYGARSMGGTVRLITVQPDLTEFSGRARALGSSTTSGSGNYAVDGALNIPLVKDVFGLRAVAYYQHDGGFINLAPRNDAPTPFPVRKDVNDDDARGVQLSGLWSLMGGNLTITPRFMYEKVERDGRTQADFTAGNRTNLREFDVPEPSENRWTLSTLTASYGAEFGKFLSASSWFDRKYNDAEDFSEWTDAVFGLQAQSTTFARTDEKIFSQELRFVSEWQGPVDLTAGVFYQRSKSHWVFPIGSTVIDGLTTDGFHLDNPTRITEKAAFAEATWHMTDRARLILGGRFFDNDVRFHIVQGGDFVGPDQAFDGTQSETGFTPKVGVQYDIDDRKMLYATYSEGFRVGGVNFFSPLLCGQEIEQLGLGNPGDFDSDSLSSYEAGLKSRWLDGRVTANGAAFLVEWSDLQQRQGLACGFTLTVNAGKAELRGTELELDFALARKTHVTVGVGYVDSEITRTGGLSTIVEGDKVKNVPDVTWNLAFDHETQWGSLRPFVHFDYGYTASSLSGNNSPTVPLRRPSFDIANLRVGAAFGDNEITLFARNVFDESANYADIPPLGVQTPGRPRIVVNEPRTIGIELRRTF